MFEGVWAGYPIVCPLQPGVPRLPSSVAAAAAAAVLFVFLGEVASVFDAKICARSAGFDS